MLRKMILLSLAASLGMLSGCGSKSDQRSETDSQLRVTSIDVGKGDCILISKGDKNIMIDTGYEDTADKIISYMKEQGTDKLDYLIVTHYDKDHVGGAAKIAENIPIDKILLPDVEGRSSYYKALMNVISDKQISFTQVSEDISFTLGEVCFKVLASDVEYELSGEEWNDNDISLVITAVYKKDSYLFAGDLENDGIKSFLAKDEGSFDVIKMPHHGQKSKKTDELIEAVSPKLAVITDSNDDPAEEKATIDEKETVYRTTQTKIEAIYQLDVTEGKWAFRSSVEKTLTVEELADYKSCRKGMKTKDSLY